MIEKINKPLLLKRLLAALVGEWGLSAVNAALAELGESSQPGDGRSPSRAPKTRPTALATVEKLAADLAPETTHALREVAQRFDEKRFLPSSGDIRHFLEMRGLDAKSVKQRHESFKYVLDAMRTMPLAEIQALLRLSEFSGPTQLGPLADAIKEASTAFRTGSSPDSEATIGGAPISENSADRSVEPVPALAPTDSADTQEKNPLPRTD